MKEAVDRIAAEVKPIAQELAEAREAIWTPDKDDARDREGEDVVDTRQLTGGVDSVDPSSRDQKARTHSRKEHS